jgi:hypothetical protein
VSEEHDRRAVKRMIEASLRRKAAEFHEAPGEAEANASAVGFLNGTGRDPNDVALGLAGADATIRAQSVNRDQANSSLTLS